MRTLPMTRLDPMVPANNSGSGLKVKLETVVSSLSLVDTALATGDWQHEASSTLLLDSDATPHLNHVSDPGTSTLNLSDSAAIVMDRERTIEDDLGLTDFAHAALEGYTPPGTGNGSSSQLVETMTAAESILIGQPVYVQSSNSVALANAYLGAFPIILKAMPIGLAKSAASGGSSVEVITEGTLEMSDWTNVIGATNLAAGQIYYLDGPTSGKLSQTAVSTDGYMSVRVGRALTTTKMDIEVSDGVILQ